MSAFARLERCGDTCRVVFQTGLEGWEQQWAPMPGTRQEGEAGAAGQRQRGSSECPVEALE